MRALIQRVSRAAIDVNGKPSGKIDQGLVVFLGVTHESEPEHAQWLAKKLLKLRLFEDPSAVATGQHSLSDIQGGILVVSQFTLHASTKKGTMPSYHRAAAPEIAEPLYDLFVENLRKLHHGQVETGCFGAHMEIHLTNDGPVTIMLDAINKE